MTATEPLGQGASSGDARELALASYRALERHRLDRRRHLFGHRHWWLWWRYSDLWPYSCAWSAANAVAALTRAVLANTWLAGAACYARPDDWQASGRLGLESRVTPPLGPGGDRYFDDNAWIGLAAVQMFDLSGDEAFLLLARRLLAFVCSGWSDDAHYAHPGGIRWKEPASSSGRTTCANGPAAALGAEVARRCHDEEALEWGLRIYCWTSAALRTPTGLYVDQIAPDGRLNSELWSYNQGSMIGAGLALAVATGDESYLDDAGETARASLAHFAPPATRRAQPDAFNAIYVRNLLAFDTVRPDPAHRRFAASVLEDLAQRREERGLVKAESDVAATSAIAEVAALVAARAAQP